MYYDLYIRFHEECLRYEENHDDNYGYTEMSYTVEAVHANEIGGFGVEKVALPWDPWGADRIFLLVVRYTDGTTFGHTSGRGMVVCGYQTEAEAEEAATLIREERSDFHGPWLSYFGSLDSVTVEAHWVQGTEPLEEVPTDSQVSPAVWVAWDTADAGGRKGQRWDVAARRAARARAVKYKLRWHVPMERALAERLDDDDPAWRAFS